MHEVSCSFYLEIISIYSTVLIVKRHFSPDTVRWSLWWTEQQIMDFRSRPQASRSTNDSLKVIQQSKVMSTQLAGQYQWSYRPAKRRRTTTVPTLPAGGDNKWDQGKLVGLQRHMLTTADCCRERYVGLILSRSQTKTSHLWHLNDAKVCCLFPRNCVQRSCLDFTCWTYFCIIKHWR